MAVIAVLVAASIGPACAASSDVSLSEMHFGRSEAGLREIQGVVKNISHHTLRQVYIAVNLLKNGMVVGYTTDIIFNLKPHEEWHIAAPCRTRVFKPTHFAVDELSAVE
ncbi:FxLYD domain-containing protein [Siccibacter turicensis]